MTLHTFRRLVTFAMLLACLLLLLACSAGYTVEPVDKPTAEDPSPDCVVISRYDNGVNDGLGSGPLGLYCEVETPASGTTTTSTLHVDE
jgi:hypothetical protein